MQIETVMKHTGNVEQFRWYLKGFLVGSLNDADITSGLINMFDNKILNPLLKYVDAHQKVDEFAIADMQNKAARAIVIARTCGNRIATHGSCDPSTQELERELIQLQKELGFTNEDEK